MQRLSCLLLALFLSLTVSYADSPKLKLALAKQLVFTDGPVTVKLSGWPVGETAVAYTLKSLDRDGQWLETPGTAPVTDGAFSIQPTREGLHLLTLPLPDNTGSVQARFLTLQPPAPISDAQKAALRASLPRAAEKLLRGDPVTLLAAGDSVTATGDYPQILAMMLGRATGNTSVHAVKKAYSGKSVDATVRHWQRDLAALREQGTPPDVGLLMYGLNDQIAGVPLEAYLEQYAWVARAFNEAGADAVFLQPTPHIDIAPWGESDAKFPLRTLGFGAELSALGRSLKVPVVPAWRAMWGEGKDSLETSARALWPLFPPSYNRQFETLPPEGGGGDTIHPNALGHLQIARAVFSTLTGTPDQPPLFVSGVTSWTKDGVTSTLTVRNDSGARRRGRLEAVPPTGASFLAAPLAYDLAPGESIALPVTWKGAMQPQQLLGYPLDRYLLSAQPLVPVVDFAAGHSRPYVVRAPFAPEAYWQRERWNDVRGAVEARLRLGGTTVYRRFAIPDEPIGRFPIVHHEKAGARENWAVGELVYTRYGAALTGEAQTDGDLDEWGTSPDLWSPVGESIQARWSCGHEDYRATPQECYTRWAFRAGEKGLYLACRATGDIKRDSFTIYFDPRPSRDLGTAGPYYWLSGGPEKNGKLKLQKGETSVNATGLRGTWRETPTGTDIEMFVPYDLMETAAWPASGDLGLSIVWAHTGPDNKVTRLMWSENGHPWNTRWYGIVRRLAAPVEAANLPYVVRLR